MRECTPPPAGSGPLPTLLLRRLCVAKSAALSRLRQELIPAAIEFERPPAVGTGRSPSRYPPDSLSRARSPNQVPEGELTKLFRGASLTLEVGGDGRLQERAQARHSGSSSQSPHRVVTREPCPPQTHSSILSMMHSSILSTAPSSKPCESVSSNVSKLFPEPSIDRLPRVGVLRPFPSHGMGGLERHFHVEAHSARRARGPASALGTADGVPSLDERVQCGGRRSSTCSELHVQCFQMPAPSSADICFVSKSAGFFSPTFLY